MKNLEKKKNKLVFLWCYFRILKLFLGKNEGLKKNHYNIVTFLRKKFFDFFKEKLACRLIYWFVQRFHTVKCVKFKSVYLSPGRQFKFHKDQFFRN